MVANCETPGQACASVAAFTAFTTRFPNHTLCPWPAVSLLSQARSLPCVCDRELVVHIISEWCLEAANHTCGDFPPAVDELTLAGFTPVPSVKVCVCWNSDAL